MSSFHPDLYRVLTTSDGNPMPYYLVPFDKKGNLRSVPLRDALLKDLRDGKYTHVIVFSHGWNNTWETANSRYSDFIRGMGQLRQTYKLKPISVPFRPLLVGIFWPSTALAFGPDEVGPDLSMQAIAGNPAALSEATLIDDVAEELDPANIARFYELAGKDSVSSDEAKELAEMVVGQIEPDEEGPFVLRDGVPILVQAESSTDRIDYVMQAWEGVQAEETALRAGNVVIPQISAQGVLDRLDPRWLVRMLSVWHMKKRSGVVGSTGVAKLLGDIRGATGARLHLIGHSYGTKVLLSAVENMPSVKGWDKPIQSMLLLQAAISGLVFASTVPGMGKPGRYKVVIDRVVQPIVCTFSERDFPLHRIYHLIFRRSGDLGDITAYAAGQTSASVFAALGGYGPQGGAGSVLPLPFYPNILPFSSSADRLYGFDGTAHISGHGDISNFATWWILYQQLQLP